jgi:hypothetical protein
VHHHHTAADLELALIREEFDVVGGDFIELDVVHETEVHLLDARFVALALAPLIAVHLKNCQRHR